MIPVLLRRAVLRIAAIVLFVTLAGATYQGAATAIERRQFHTLDGWSTSVIVSSTSTAPATVRRP